MRITNDDVRRIARLARLDLAEGEIERLRDDLGTILTHVATLETIEDAGAEAPTRRSLGVLRPDRPRRAPSPDAVRGLIRLPRVIEP